MTAANPQDIAVIGVRVGITELTGSSVTVAVSERVELHLWPVTASGLTIDGNAPEVQAGVVGTSATITPGIGDSLWIDGTAPGVSTLSLTWGAASREIAVDVIQL